MIIKFSFILLECWEEEPNERPDIQKVVLDLKALIFPEQNDKIIEDVDEEKGNRSLEKFPSKVTTDPNRDLILDNIDKIIEDNFIESENRLSNAPIQEIDLSNDRSESNNINDAIVDELINFIVEKNDRGFTFDKVKQLIVQQILQINLTTDQLISWLSDNQNQSQYIWLFGLFNHYNIGIEKDGRKSSKLFLKASDDYSMAQVYLAKCYYDGYGRKENKDLAFHWYQRSVENGSITGQFYLGYCYINGIGTEVNKEKAFELYKIAASKEHRMAQNNLALLYKNGEGTEKNFKKAFYWYQKAAGNGEKTAQNVLGNLYKEGEGIKKDLKKAFYWYQKAAENNNNIAQNDLAFLYKKGEGKKKDLEKAFYWYQKAAENDNKAAMYNLAIYYQYGEGTENNLEKAFYWYQKAAENDNEIAQNDLAFLYKNGEGTEKNLEKAFYWYQKAAKNGNKIAQNNLASL